MGKATVRICELCKSEQRSDVYFSVLDRFVDDVKIDFVTYDTLCGNCYNSIMKGVEGIVELLSQLGDHK